MTRGAAHVRAQLKARGLSQNDGAALFGCDSGNFSRMLRDPNRGPGRLLADEIRKEFGTEIPWWDEEISDEEAAAMLAAADPAPASEPTPTPHDSGEMPAVVEPTGSEG
jgi:hypothetical protein